MEKREPYPLIEITAETPFERGVQYGSQAVDRIGICIEYYKESFRKQGFTGDSGGGQRAGLRFRAGAGGDYGGQLPV